MDILSDVDEHVACLRFVGDFDTMDVATFEAHVADCTAAGSTRLLVDATEMRLINSSAIQSLLRTQVGLAQQGGAFAVTGLSPFATTVFETLGIDRRIRCFASDAEARAWLLES